MGWGRMLLLGNVGQQLDISDLNNEVARMHDAVAGNLDLDREQGAAIRQLQQENHELKLYLAKSGRDGLPSCPRTGGNQADRTFRQNVPTKQGVLKPEEVETTVRAIER